VRARCGTRRPLAGLHLTAALLLLVIASPAVAAQVILTWTDNATDELGFRVERRLNPGTYLLNAEIGTVGANVTSYADSTITAGQAYCYRVRAYNAVGNSDYSSEACGTAAAQGAVTVTVVDGGAGSGAGSGEAALLCVHIGIRRGLYTIIRRFSTLGVTMDKPQQYRGNRRL